MLSREGVNASVSWYSRWNEGTDDVQKRRLQAIIYPNGAEVRRKKHEETRRETRTKMQQQEGQGGTADPRQQPVLRDKTNWHESPGMAPREQTMAVALRPAPELPCPCLNIQRAWAGLVFGSAAVKRPRLSFASANFQALDEWPPCKWSRTWRRLELIPRPTSTCGVDPARTHWPHLGT